MQVQSTTANPFGTTSTAPPVTGAASPGAASTGASGSSSAASSATGSSAAPTESMFLQLLVAQMKYQDPTNPQDATQFVGELAQFSQLEQTIGIRTDTDSISQDLSSAAAAASATPSTTTTPASS
jgi:flagellar basal-body rod modification protein FlgD